MATNDPNPLYESIERAALAVYGELLSPELAHSAATAFAREAASMVDDMLQDGAAVLRDQIEGQLATLSGGKGKGKGKKRAAKKAAPRRAEPKKVEAVAEPVEAPAPDATPVAVVKATAARKKAAAT